MRPFLLRLQLPNTSLNGGNVCLATLHSSDRDCTPHTTYVTLQDNSRTFSWLILPRRLQTLYMNTSLSKSKQTFLSGLHPYSNVSPPNVSRTFIIQWSVFSQQAISIFSELREHSSPFFSQHTSFPLERFANSDPFLHSKQLICAVNTVNI
jgi:hypothetical protein